MREAGGSLRRLILENPLARSALWSRNIALFALVVALIGIVLSHKGLEARATLSIEAGALAMAGLAVLFALFAMAVIWHTGYRGVGLALEGIVIAGALFLYPAYLVRLHRTPTVEDITTSLDDPPHFLETIPAVLSRNGYIPPKEPSRTDLAQQEKLYPDLQTLDLDADTSDVEAALHKLIKRRKWKIVDETKPENFATGHIDLVVKPGLMGFPSDITIRIRGIGARTQVDIRSASRSPWQEKPGANAERVQTLSDDLLGAIGES